MQLDLYSMLSNGDYSVQKKNKGAFLILRKYYLSAGEYR